MGNRPVRSAADHSLRWTVLAREDEEGKGDWRSGKTKANARENSQRSDSAKTRGRDGLAGRGNALSQGVQVPKRSR
jgi:hypothetical protein